MPTVILYNPVTGYFAFHNRANRGVREVRLIIVGNFILPKVEINGKEVGDEILTIQEGDYVTVKSVFQPKFGFEIKNGVVYIKRGDK